LNQGFTCKCKPFFMPEKRCG